MIDILQSQTFAISPGIESRDTGWVISGQMATHYPCNPGTMKSIGAAGLVIGKTYVVTYEVVSVISGSVKVLLGTTAGISRTAAGVYTENITVAGTAGISFYSDGYLTIEDNLSFYELVDVVDNSITIAFYDGDGTSRKKWVGYYSYSPGMMIKFINKYFTVKDGALWMQNVNETRNNFYGQQYASKIKFYDNPNPSTVKLFYSIRVEANTRWFCPNNGDISILPVVGRSAGMSSRLKRNNFKNYQGSFFADFMRNYLDPRFMDGNVALFKGEPLRGRFMEVTITNDDTTEAVLYEVDIKSTPSSYTY